MIKRLQAGEQIQDGPWKGYVAPIEGYYEVQQHAIHRIGSTVGAQIKQSYTVPTSGTYTISLPPGVTVQVNKTGNIEARKGHQLFGDDYGDDYSSNYKSIQSDKLKCKCWRCDKEFVPNQYFDYSISKHSIALAHCGREQTIHLTDKQIEENNKSGFYYAFMY